MLNQHFQNLLITNHMSSFTDISCYNISFLSFSAHCYVAKDQLKIFQETNHAWLYMADVYKEITENVRVTVIPFYMGIQESYNKFWVSDNFIDPSTFSLNQISNEIFQQKVNISIYK